MTSLNQTLTTMESNGWKILGTTIRLSTEETLYLVEREGVAGAMTRGEMEEMTGC